MSEARAGKKKLRLTWFVLQTRFLIYLQLPVSQLPQRNEYHLLQANDDENAEHDNLDERKLTLNVQDKNLKSAAVFFYLR